MKEQQMSQAKKNPNTPDLVCRFPLRACPKHVSGFSGVVTALCAGCIRTHQCTPQWHASEALLLLVCVAGAKYNHVTSLRSLCQC